MNENTKINDLDISIRLKKILCNNKIFKIEDLLQINKNSLIRYRGLGKSTYKELIDFMNLNNLEFNN